MVCRLVLLPGLDGTGHLFAPLLQELPASMQPVVVAYPERQAMSYEALLEHVQKLLPTDQPYVLLGESFAGPLALMLAARQQAVPDSCLRGVVLCCSFACNPRPGLGVLAPLLQLALPRPPWWAINVALLGAWATPALQAAVRHAVGRVSVAVLRQRLQAVVKVDARAHLAQLRVPVVYLRALHDRLVPTNVATQMQQLSPHMQVLDAQAPHGLLQTQPQWAAAALQRFIQALTLDVLK